MGAGCIGYSADGGVGGLRERERDTVVGGVVVELCDCVVVSTSVFFD